MSTKKDEDLIQRLKDVFDSVIPAAQGGDYPKEGLPVGTYVRSIRHQKLGIITDAFYGDVDKDNQKIIIYTILLFPKSNFSSPSKITDQHYITNEYEYEIIGFLMIPPADLSKLTFQLGGGLFL